MAIVDPGLVMPIQLGDPVAESDSAMIVTFAVPVRPWNVHLSISLCIRITIGGLTVSIYYNKLALADGNMVNFNALLPIGAEIIDTVATYNVAYPA